MLRGRGRGGYLVSCGGEGRVEAVRVMVVENVVSGTCDTVCTDAVL